MLRKFQNIKSPKISKMIDLFKKQNKNSNDKKKYNTKTLNPNKLNNQKRNIYNTKTEARSNMSKMSQSPQSIMIDYSLITSEIKKKKNRGVFDATSHRNKNIFIETDSEQYNSRKNSKDSFKTKRKRCCSKLIVDKITSHAPDTLSRGKGKIIKNNNINNNNNQNVPNILNDLNDNYSINTYNNNFNMNDINDLYNLNNSDGYEYEKSETIKIRKIFIPNGQNRQNGQNGQNMNNNRIEKKNMIFHNILNSRNPDNNIYRYNSNTSDNLESNLNKEKNLQKERRTNNLSYTSSDLRSPKYPFVIKTKSKDAPKPYELYYRTIKNPNPNTRYYKTNYNNIYKESPNDLDNNNKYYIPLNDKNLTETSDSHITPEKQNNFNFHKKRIYQNNDINSDNNNDSNINDYNKYNYYQPKNLKKLSNNINSNYDDERSEPQYIYANDNNNSVGKDSYRNSKEKKSNNDYGIKYRLLFIQKEKEYNHLLGDYNDIVVKYNKLKGQYNKLYNDKNNDNGNSLNKNNNDIINGGKKEINKDDLKNLLINHFSSNLKISPNNNISFLKKNNK